MEGLTHTVEQVCVCVSWGDGCFSLLLSFEGSRQKSSHFTATVSAKVEGQRQKHQTPIISAPHSHTLTLLVFTCAFDPRGPRMPFFLAKPSGFSKK